MLSDFIGKYQILERLGGGTFGEVYKCEDTVLGRVVAVKVAAGGEEKTKSLLSEARLLIKLRHPNVVEVYDANFVGREFIIVMEYLAGGSLSQLITTDSGPMTEAAAAKIGCEILAGLAAAHKLGIIHRDIKPGNILFGDDGVAQLGDFGISKMIEATRLASTVVGTPPYMAPEHLLGKATLHSDIYSVGVVLYEISTGHRAFQGDSDYIVMKKVEHGDFPPPRVVNAGLSQAMEKVILQAMAREPEGRFRSAQTFAAALTSFQETAKRLRAEPVTDKTKLIKPTVAIDAVGKSLAEAARAAETAGVKLKVISRIHHPGIPAGYVISQNIGIGGVLGRNAEMGVIVSLGPAKTPAATPVPKEGPPSERQAFPPKPETQALQPEPLTPPFEPVFETPPLEFEAVGRAQEQRDMERPVSPTTLRRDGGIVHAELDSARETRVFWTRERKIGAAIIAVFTLLTFTVGGLALGGFFNPKGKEKGVTVAAPISPVRSPEPTAVGGNVKTVTTVRLPDCKGVGEGDARERLKTAGYNKVRVIKEKSPIIPAGFVISQKPVGGTELPQDREVTLVVSSGKPTTPETPVSKVTVAVPVVSRMASANARARLEGAGFRVRAVEKADNRIAKGYVINQTPTGRAVPGATIIIYISSGAGGSGSPEPGKYVFCPKCGRRYPAGTGYCAADNTALGD